jgi:SM-20-related protein
MNAAMVACIGPAAAGIEFDRLLAQALRSHDCVVLDGFLAASQWRPLAARAQSLADAGELLPARVGRGGGVSLDPALRGDRTRWLTRDDRLEAALLDRLELLLATLNRELLLGLTEVEAHFAHYPPGARYVRHRDRFRDDDRRVLSLALYLNDDWQENDGGALRIHAMQQAAQAQDLLPLAGRAVALLSASVEHEVLPASRDRYSVAAWFRSA